MVPSVDASGTCAFVAGINAYKHFTPLKNAVGDANKFDDALRKVGVKRITSATNCSYDQLTEKTNTYLSKMRNGDVAVVYLAAHAGMYRNQNVVLTKTSDKTNLAHTSLRVPLLLLRQIIPCCTCLFRCHGCPHSHHSRVRTR